MDHTRDGNRYTFTISDVVNHKLASVGGVVETKFEGDNNIGHIIYSGNFYKSSENETIFDADVLSIDYASYCIVHHCKHDSKKKFHHEFIWILSRTPDLSPDTRNTIDAFLNSTIIDQRQLIWDHFSKQYCDFSKY
ncbi:bilin-binding protein-like [Aricia agestis]|uniref:bilin-binding protein-like n=1 Tax=Aricia agestis TaxID=91739 RepID=UPI001C2087C8|nr:bilin-binding protein-like [Aricia agestis]